MSYLYNRRLELTLNVTSLGKKRGRRSIVVSRESSPDVFDLVLTAAGSPGEKVDTKGVDAKVIRKLVDLGLIVEPADETPDVHFDNPLRALPPGGGRAPARLRRNRRTWLEAPASLAHFEAFDRKAPLLWIEDPATRFVHPVSVLPRDVPAVKALLASGELPTKASDLRDALWRAGALVDPAEVREARAQRASAMTEARASLEASKYAVVRGVVPEVFRSAAQTYLRSLSKAGYLLKEPDGQSKYRHSFHNEPLNRFTQFQLTKLVDRVVGERVKPSFAYLSIYRAGALLAKHIDRKQCAWNMSVQLDREAPRSTRKAWPIFLEVRKEARRVDLALGDAVIYSGTDTPHWRLPMPKGWSTSTVCSYHYVDRAYRGALE